MGLGLVTAAGVQGGFDELERILAKRIEEQRYRDTLQQREFENQLKVRAASASEEANQFNRERLSRADQETKAERDRQEQQRESQRTDQLVNDLEPNVFLSEESGRLIEKWRPELQRRNYAYPPFLEGQGTIRSTVPGQQPGRIFTGTAGQLRLQRTDTDVNQRADDRIAAADRRAADTVAAAEARAAAAAQNRRTLSATAEANLIHKLNATWTKAGEPKRMIDRQLAMMDAGLQAAERGDLAQGAQAVLVTFQKILDPPSVVREAEYERSSAGLSMLNRVRGAYERIIRGGAGVPLPELRKFAQLAKEAAAGQHAWYLSGVKKRLESQADRYSIPPELIFEDDSPASEPGAGAVPFRIISEEPIGK